MVSRGHASTLAHVAQLLALLCCTGVDDSLLRSNDSVLGSAPRFRAWDLFCGTTRATLLVFVGMGFWFLDASDRLEYY